MDLSKLDMLQITNVDGRLRAFDSKEEIVNMEAITITIPKDDIITAFVVAEDRIKTYIVSNMNILSVGELEKKGVMIIG